MATGWDHVDEGADALSTRRRRRDERDRDPVLGPLAHGFYRRAGESEEDADARARRFAERAAKAEARARAARLRGLG